MKRLFFFLVPVVALMNGCGERVDYKGRLTDEAGTPIRSALVSLEEDGQVIASDTTGKDGRFSVGTVEGGWGCGALSDGYKLTLRRDDTPNAAFAELRGHYFADLGDVKLLDQTPQISIDDTAVVMETTSLAVRVDDGLTWNVSGVGAMPIEALGKAGKHTFRRIEKQFVGQLGGALHVTSPAVEVESPTLPTRVALAESTPAYLTDGSFAASTMYDQSSVTLALREPSAVRLVLFAGVTSEYNDLTKATLAVEITQGGVAAPLSDVACSLHDTTVQCAGDFPATEAITLRFRDVDAQPVSFRTNEALVY